LRTCLKSGACSGPFGFCDASFMLNPWFVS
jgi:hypothetical protein